MPDCAYLGFDFEAEGLASASCLTNVHHLEFEQAYLGYNQTELLGILKFLKTDTLLSLILLRGSNHYP